VGWEIKGTFAPAVWTELFLHHRSRPCLNFGGSPTTRKAPPRMGSEGCMRGVRSFGKVAALLKQGGPSTATSLQASAPEGHIL